MDSSKLIFFIQMLCYNPCKFKHLLSVYHLNMRLKNHSCMTKFWTLTTRGTHIVETQIACCRNGVEKIKLMGFW